MAGEVPNPTYEAISRLYRGMEQDLTAMADALQDACDRMATGQVWEGPAASAWNNSLIDHSSDLSTQVRRTLDEVADALQAMPPTVVQISH
jgi:hypothetical protein